MCLRFCDYFRPAAPPPKKTSEMVLGAGGRKLAFLMNSVNTNLHAFRAPSETRFAPSRACTRNGFPYRTQIKIKHKNGNSGGAKRSEEKRSGAERSGAERS